MSPSCICGNPNEMKKADFFFNAIRVPLDFLMLLLAGLVAYALRTGILDQYRPVQFAVDLPPERFALLTAGAAALFVIVYALAGLYVMKLRMTKVQEATRIVVASSAAIMLVILFIFLRQELFNSRFLVIGYWLLATFFVVIGRMALRLAQRHLMARYDIGVHRVLLIGSDQVSVHLWQTMMNDPGLGWRVVRHLDDPDMAELAAAVKDPGVDEVILANPDYPAERIVPLVDFCHEHHIIFKFVPNIYQTLTTHYDVDAIDRIPVVELRRTALDGWGRIFKRAFDVIVSILALIVLAPIFGLVALAIKWDTAGPVFVRLPRVSRNRQFKLLKFRGMIAVDPDGSAESLKAALMARNERSDSPLFKMKDDPRVTRVGRFIRRYRIDELPQFINVLKGDMSVVGPRPHQPDEIARYAKHHRKVLAIKAGATGMAQVAGASDLSFEDEVALDTFYIENWSLLLDLRICLKTALRLFSDGSAV